MWRALAKPVRESPWLANSFSLLPKAAVVALGVLIGKEHGGRWRKRLTGPGRAAVGAEVDVAAVARHEVIRDADEVASNNT